MKLDTIFKDLSKKYGNTTQIALIFWLCAALLMIGVNNFYEDTLSSYHGLVALELRFGVMFGSWEATYWLGSLFFQVVTMISMFVYLSNSDKNKKWLALAIGSQAIDFVTDVFYRSSEFNTLQSILVGLALTFVYFTVGSEVSLTVGLSAVRFLMKDGLEQTIKLVASIVYSLVSATTAGVKIAKDYWNELDRSQSYSSPNNKQNQRPPVQQAQNRQPAFQNQVPMNQRPPVQQHDHNKAVHPENKPNIRANDREQWLRAKAEEAARKELEDVS